MSKKYKVLIIGAGKIGVFFSLEKDRPQPGSYIGAFINNKDVSGISIYDTNHGTLKKVKLLFSSVSICSSLEDALKIEKPDIVVVASSTNSHLEIIKKIISSDCKLIICEKPLSNDLESARKIIKLLKDSKKLFVLNHQRRFFSLFKKARSKIQKGDLGEILQVTAYYSNGLFNNGSHIIDTLRFLLDSDVDYVVGLKNENNMSTPSGDINADCLLNFKDKIRASLQNLDNSKYGIHDIHIYGTKGVLHITDYGYSFSWHKVKSSSFFKELKELSSQNVKEHKRESMIMGIVEYSFKLMKLKKQDINFAEESYRNMLILDAIKRSADQNGKKIKLNYEKK